MKMQDLHKKVEITLTYKEAEKLWSFLYEAIDIIEDDKTAQKLYDKLDEYINT